MNKPLSKRVKRLRIGFYTSSDVTKNKNSSLTKKAFNTLYKECTSTLINYKIVGNQERKLKITFLEKDDDAGFFYGFMTMHRNSAHLAYISDNDTFLERKIPLTPLQSLAERSYFLYYFNTDLLLLSENHLGPKATDLSYALFSLSNRESRVSFSAIWKEESIRELFESGTILKTCEVTIAAPRDFNKTNYDLKHNLSSQIAEMLAGSGTSHLDLVLRGKSSKTSKGYEYLSEDVKQSIKEMIEKFKGGKSGAEVQRADVIRKGSNRKTSLLDQVLRHTKNVIIQNDGYPKDDDVKQALIQSKIDNLQYLSQYEVATDQ
ncbi:hypothetical protein [Proteus mirabilis]|uniref:hypothetical protein n=1 Tax=Proteus mirabilis TaxID=584 RepID=UPI0018C4A86B|nr:hypothetical protein [Proteus mirabilis]MBG2993250.1 hypothetical protein [Proteus mirabilis]MDS0824352.1 hypothetical protein [Proteus mirabilis]